jgi:ABC-type sugar transport system ATPase subunit
VPFFGGEQQVVAIGRALLFDRDIILMDEPTAAISLQKVRDVLELIKRLRSLGKTVILVSHRLEDILEVSDRIVIFSRGRIAKVVNNTKALGVTELSRLMFEGTASAHANHHDHALATTSTTNKGREG